MSVLQQGSLGSLDSCNLFVVGKGKGSRHPCSFGAASPPGGMPLK